MCKCLFNKTTIAATQRWYSTRELSPSKPPNSHWRKSTNLDQFSRKRRSTKYRRWKLCKAHKLEICRLWTALLLPTHLIMKRVKGTNQTMQQAQSKCELCLQKLRYQVCIDSSNSSGYSNHSQAIWLMITCDWCTKSGRTAILTTTSSGKSWRTCTAINGGKHS
jgi:hypothetical protein